jgi:hypothetical protein
MDKIQKLLSADILSITARVQFHTIRVLRRYFQDIFEQRPSLQHAIYEWSGLVILNIMYNLRVSGVPHIISQNPGNTADYIPITTPGTVGHRMRVVAEAVTARRPR